jgi:uncharacterized protein (UPF0261 family)
VKIVVAIGTLDTKGAEYEYLRQRLAEHARIETLLVDAGVLGEPTTAPDVDRFAVAAAAGTSLEELRSTGDRGAAVAAMARGAGEVVRRLHAEGRLDGIVGLGGSGGSALISHAMRQLPVGVPKLLVSTVASGDTRPYVGAVDVTMMYSVADVAGINQISARVIANAAGAIAGMVGTAPPKVEGRPLIAASMFGVTTPCVTAARENLEANGYEVLVFHQTGTGGASMEELIKAGYVAGVLDVTTTELADELVGGVFAADAGRLLSAGAAGIPQVVSVGALDMVNFGPRDSVPAAFVDRNLYVHNPSVTLMRTTPGECAELGRRLAAKLNAALGPTALFLPLKGVSMIATSGQPFFDPDADAALFEALRSELADHVEVVECDCAINDPEFALAMAGRLETMIEERG